MYFCIFRLFVCFHLLGFVFFTGVVLLPCHGVVMAHVKTLYKDPVDVSKGTRTEKDLLGEKKVPLDER